MVVLSEMPVFTLGQYFSFALSRAFYKAAALSESLGRWLAASENAFHKSAGQIAEEAELVGKAQADPRFFGAIYEKYYEQIFIFIDRRVSDEEVSADLCAQTFFKCLHGIGKYTFRGLPFSAWLFKIALNEINLYFRAQKHRERSVRLTHKHVDFLCEELEAKDSDQENVAIVTKLLESLSPEDVQFLELRFFEGRPFEEIAFILGLSAVNAKIKTYRILKKLKEYAVKLKHA